MSGPEAKVELVAGNGCVEVSGVLVTLGVRIRTGVFPEGHRSRVRLKCLHQAKFGQGWKTGSYLESGSCPPLDWSPPLVLMPGG